MEINPEDLTLEQVKEQLAIYSRLYYQKRKQDKDFMDKKRANTMRRYRRKKIDEMIKNGALDLKDDDEPEEEENIRGKPKKYEDTKMMILAVNKNK